MSTLKSAGLVVITGALLMTASPATAQEKKCSIKKQIEQNTYEVAIDNTAYIAVLRQQFLGYVKKEEELKGANDKIKELNGVITDKQAILDLKQKQIAELEKLIAKAEESASKWKTASDKCEIALQHCCGSARLSLELGGGMTSDSDAAGMVGIGYGRFRAWGFFQKGESAGLIGLEIPILK